MTAEPLTDAELAEIEARADKATFGPWEHLERRSNWNTLGFERLAGGHIHDDLALDHQIVTSWIHGQAHDKVAIVGVAVSPYREHMHFIHVRPEDAEFIAAARTDLPRLLNEVRRLRALVGEPD